MLVITHQESPLLAVAHRGSPSLATDHRGSPGIAVAHRNLPLLTRDCCRVACYGSPSLAGNRRCSPGSSLQGGDCYYRARNDAARGANFCVNHGRQTLCKDSDDKRDDDGDEGNDEHEDVSHVKVTKAMMNMNLDFPEIFRQTNRLC